MAFTNYSVQILAYTSAGDGELSAPVACATEPDGECVIINLLDIVRPYLHNIPLLIYFDQLYSPLVQTVAHLSIGNWHFIIGPSLCKLCLIRKGDISIIGLDKDYDLELCAMP